MADSTVTITSGTGTNIDTRTETTNSQHRQVVVLGDPALNNNVAAVATQDLAGTDQTTPAIVARIAGSITIQQINSSMSVYLSATSGTVTVKLDPGYNIVNDSATIVLPRTVSGTANGISVSGNTIVSPVANRVIKVYAIALTTTAQVGLATRFTNGGGSATEFWRYALQAPSQGIAGANLSVTPPAYLFATASGSTLSLVLDSSSLVHYSVGYFLESA